MSIFLRLCLAAVLAAVVSACSSLITGGELVRPGEPTGIIEVVNDTSGKIDVILISDCSASSYGLNRLAQGSYLAPGESGQFVVSAGCWDVDAGTIGYGEARQRLTVHAGGISRYTVGD